MLETLRRGDSVVSDQLALQVPQVQGFGANTQKASGKLGQGGHPMASRVRDCSLEGQTAQAQSAWLCFDGVARV